MSGDDDSSRDEDNGHEIALSGSKRKFHGKAVDELTEEELANADLDELELDPEKRREVRKMRRVMANRRSARESRERKKKLLAELEESVETLTSENFELSKENESLRKELITLIDQSGGVAALSTIPNIASILQATPGIFAQSTATT